jgi:hypothetical protein
MRKNFLSFEEYRKKCEKLGERESDAQEKLAGFLHSLGVVLNFRDDPRLNDTHVLKPDWVTSGIYTVLNSHKLAEQDGQIQVSDLGGILDKKRYPVRMHGLLLDLMRKFDLCFAFDQPEHYLIPRVAGQAGAGGDGRVRPGKMPEFPVPLPGAAGGADPALHRPHPRHEHGAAALALRRDLAVRG